MKILHLHEKTAIHGGAEVYISQLQELLPKYTCETYWLGIDETSGHFLITQYNNAKTIRLNRLTDVLKYLKTFSLERGIDLINIHNIFNPEIIRFCFGISPVVKSVHSPVMVCPGRDKFWRYSEKPCCIPYGLHCFKHIYTEGCSNRHPKRVLKAWNHVNFELHEAVEKYKSIVVMSEYIRKGLLECGVPDSKIFCTPYFTNEISFAEKVAEPNSGIKEILFIGRLVSSKGPHIMLSALSSLLHERHDIRIKIIGDGQMKEQLITQTIALNVRDKVSFSGWLAKDEIDKCIAKCYMVVFPSIYPEAFGIVGIEAMMQGKPVVGFDVGGVSTWLKNDETGFLIDLKNTLLLKEKVALLLSDSKLYQTMSKNSKSNAMKLYTPVKHLSTLVNIYKKAL